MASGVHLAFLSLSQTEQIEKEVAMGAVTGFDSWFVYTLHLSLAISPGLQHSNNKHAKVQNTTNPHWEVTAFSLTAILRVCLDLAGKHLIITRSFYHGEWQFPGRVRGEVSPVRQSLASALAVSSCCCLGSVELTGTQPLLRMTPMCRACSSNLLNHCHPTSHLKINPCSRR